ncbi:MAG: DUF4416 family protein [Deltaproteobacteria bacterium]|nr:DUF4416 family protein [Deltaproteobacteria bacterium]
MKDTRPVEAKGILFLLTNRKELAEDVMARFTSLLGEVEHKSAWHPFENKYYEEEMGPNLERCLVCFENIFEPWRLAELKELAKEMESHPRTINIDPGYVDLSKVVLASGKGGGQKIALAQNIYAHTVLRYEKGKWIPSDGTFPDLKEETYHRDLLKIRAALKESANRL